MRCTLDAYYAYHGYWTAGALCRIEVYEEEGRPPVLLCTELPENTNTSITNMAEYLAAEVVTRVLPQRLDVIGEEPFLWIEHYPYDPILHDGPTYDRVTFATLRPRIVPIACGTLRQRLRFGAPTWRRLSCPEMADLLGMSEESLLLKGGVPVECLTRVLARARRHSA